MVYSDFMATVCTVSFLGHVEVLEGYQVCGILSSSLNEKVCVLCVHAHVYLETAGIRRTLPFPTEKACTFAELGLDCGQVLHFQSPLMSAVSRVRSVCLFLFCRAWRSRCYHLNVWESQIPCLLFLLQKYLHSSRFLDLHTIFKLIY